jgi:hypothetical protein
MATGRRYKFPDRGSRDSIDVSSPNPGICSLVRGSATILWRRRSIRLLSRINGTPDSNIPSAHARNRERQCICYTCGTGSGCRCEGARITRSTSNRRSVWVRHFWVWRRYVTWRWRCGALPEAVQLLVIIHDSHAAACLRSSSPPPIAPSPPTPPFDHPSAETTTHPPLPEPPALRSWRCHTRHALRLPDAAARAHPPRSPRSAQSTSHDPPSSILSHRLHELSTVPAGSSPLIVTRSLCSDNAAPAGRHPR